MADRSANVAPTNARCVIDSWLGLVAVAVLIVINGTFVAGEFALVATDQAKLDSVSGPRRARLVRGLLARLSFHLSGAQFGITISSLLLGQIAEDAFGSTLALIPGIDEGTTLTVLLALFVATALQMVLGELLPKNLAIARPEATSAALSPALTLYGAVAKPLIRSFDGTANWLVRRMGIEPVDELHQGRSRDELAYVIQSSADQGTLANDEFERLKRVIRFGDRNVADVLVPRADMVVVAADATLTELTELSVATGRSRLPVIGDSLDDLRGVIDVTQILSVEPSERPQTKVSDLATDVLVVPEGRDLDRLLGDFRDATARLAVVVDEHGGVAGLVTLEDLLEELVGEINDEYDDDAVTHTLRAGRLEVDGGTHIDDVGELIGAQLPDGPYETIAGLVLSLAGRIPSIGDTIDGYGWHFQVLDGDHRRVTRLAITRDRSVR